MTNNDFLCNVEVNKEIIVMHAKGFLHELLTPVIHRTRVKALTEVVLAAICTKELVLTKLGRAIDSGIQERSGIQKVNRLLGNKYLLMEHKIISQVIGNLLIGNKKHPEIIVDWSKYPNSEDAILRAALVAEGRALTLYEERHPVKKMGNRKVQKNFLMSLKKILPADCKAIIVTDAGFHNDWFREVLKLDWDYIGRIRGMKKCRLQEEKAFRACKKLFKLATNKVKCLGEMILTKKNPMVSYGYLVKGKLQGRKALTKQGKVRKDKDSKAYSRAHREPWLLVSSLRGRNAAKKVARIYSHRMTIEEAFRDLKSSRYGLGLDESKTKIKKRRDILLLIGMLASLIAWVTGLAGEKMKLQYQFQSNSIKHRRVISLFYLGCQIIRKKIPIRASLIWNIIASLRQEAIYV
jgi:hypothetical protein